MKGQTCNPLPVADSSPQTSPLIRKKSNNPSPECMNCVVTLGDVIGEGAYGKVYKGFIKKTGKFIAVKEVLLKENDDSQNCKINKFLMEI